MKPDALWCDVQCVVECTAGCAITDGIGAVLATGYGIASC